jgi:hypothetical protein
MYLQLSYIIKPLHIGDTDKIAIEVKYKDKQIMIDFEKIPPEKMQKGYEVGDLLVSATVQLDLSEKREKQFLEIKSPLSNSEADFIKPIHMELYDCILKSIKGLRWRLRNESSANPIKFWGGFRYSSDGKTWKSFPDQVKLTINFGFAVKKEYSNEELLSIQQLMSKGEYEPISHELLHEAWELRKDSTRSSLVIGLAAAETGFKHFSSKFVPAASWLIMNVPTPPLIKMLENFLPQIQTKNKIYGYVLAPPKELLDILTKSVELRNKVVHGANASLKKETVEEVLNSIRDLLYLLDYYSGHTWAWSHINGTVLQSLVNEAITRNEKKV